MRVVYGPPGTGKTRYLMDAIERALASGIEPQRIAFVSFTTAAVNEARDRAMKRFGLAARDLPYFRTLHSLAFSSLGLSRSAVMGSYAAFASASGLRLRGDSGIDAVFAEKGADDVLLHAHQLVAATGLPFEEVARQYQLRVNPDRYTALLGKLGEWKRDKDQWEFSDMLAEFIRSDIQLPVEAAFIDEAQDLTPQQWDMVNVAFRGAADLWVAGDDDQAIYQWAGARVERLLALKGEHIVLDHSHRLPERIKRVADDIAARIAVRKPKTWSGTGRAGRVIFNASLRDFELEPGTWRMLARTSYALRPLVDFLQSSGIPYRLNGDPVLREQEVESYRAMLALRAGEAVEGNVVRSMLSRGAWNAERFKIRSSQRVTRAQLDERVLLDERALLANIPSSRLRFMRHVAARGDWSVRVDASTIHQAKGAEADHVIIAPSLSPASALALRVRDYADAENRVWYVAASRARESMRVLRFPGETEFRLG